MMKEKRSFGGKNNDNVVIISDDPDDIVLKTTFVSRIPNNTYVDKMTATL